MHHRTILITLLMSITLVLSGCTSDGDDEEDRDTTTGDGDGGPVTSESEQDGRVVAFVKDAPEDDFHELWVVFTGVHVHRGGDDGNGTGNTTGDPSTQGGWQTIWQGEKALDLLRLSGNDTRALLGGKELGPGTYQQVRLDLDEAWGVRSSDFRNLTIDVTTGQATATQRFVVSGNATTELIIDLDLDRSLGEQRGGGAQGGGTAQESQWRLNPVIGSVAIVTR